MDIRWNGMNQFLAGAVGWIGRGLDRVQHPSRTKREGKRRCPCASFAHAAENGRNS